MANTENNPSKISEIPESYQRYIDEIYDIARTNKGGWVSNKELAKGLEVKPASVSGMLEKLRDQGYIHWEPRKRIRLTKKGKQVGIQLNETHNLLRTFFKEVLKIKDEEIVENLSCEIEHHITKKVKESFKKFLSQYVEE